MDFTAVGFAVLQVVEKLEKVVNKYHERGDITKDNREQLRRLKRHYSEAAILLRRLEHLSTPDYVTVTRMRLHETTLGEDMDRLMSWQEPIDKAKRTDRVKRMKEVLSLCEANLKEFFDFLGNKISPMLEASSSQPDVYTPRNTVPPNPPRLLLDYSTTATCEGELKAAVLHDMQSRIVAVVASGKGGVGKTCALRGLANDSEVKQMFPGGILFIQLRNDAGIPNVVKGIANIVERTGGSNLARAIVGIESLQVAAEKASDWFHPRSCLLLVDDIWRVNGINAEVLTILGSMLNDSSRLVYTTRDRHFLDRADRVVEFTEKETYGELSRRMLMRHANFSEQCVLDRKNAEAFESLLRTCQGLPLAFGIVGSSVLKISRRKSSGKKQDAWSYFYQDLTSNSEDMFGLSSTQYGPLSNIVDISLQVLERQDKHERYGKIFRSLCVLQKQQNVSVHVLQKLWNLGDLKDAEQIAYGFEEVSIVQLRREGNLIFICLHDLVLDLAIRKASEMFESQKVFQTLVRNYVPIGQRKEPWHEWWKFEDDGYIFDNLCRILRSAGYVDELLWLLSKPQWIAKRLVDAGIYSVELDVGHGEAIADDKVSGHSNRKEFLQTVRKAARMSSTFVADNPREVWFQLHV